MVIALTTNQSTAVVLDADAGNAPEDQTVFDLAPLSVAQRQAVVKLAESGDNVGACVLACHGSLRGWRNLRDAEGADVEYKRKQQNVGGSAGVYVRPECLDALPLDVLGELGAKALEVSGMSDDERGK